MELGLGAGWFEREFRAYGPPFPPIGERIGRLAEAVQVIRSMWTERSPSFAGRYHAIAGAICDPRPVQRPHSPIWIGGEGDRVHRVAARAASGVNVPWWPPEQYAAAGVRHLLLTIPDVEATDSCDCISVVPCLHLASCTAVDWLWRG